MLIDWFTVIAQIVNFLILVWLLKRFLYKPVLKAIDEREKKIAARLLDAESLKTAAGKEREDFQGRITDFDRQRDEKWREAVKEIGVEKERLLDDARNESASLRTKLEESLKEEQRNIGLTIRRKTQAEVFAIARKTLNDLAGDSLEQNMVNVFLARLNNLGGEEKKQLGSVLLSPKGTVSVRSATNLAQSQQEQIRNAVNELSGTKIQMVFTVNPELISGIELNANGYRLGWNISGYLGSLEKRVAETLNAGPRIDEKDKEISPHAGLQLK